MADIFISYASEDRSRVAPLAKSLEDQGWSVFWDFTIPVGKTWRQLITEALDAAKCAVVVWSSTSINSNWVHEEAEEAQERQILVPAMIDKVKPPLGFRRMQAARLLNWAGEPNHREFVKLQNGIEAILGLSPKKVKEAEQLRVEEERRRKQEEEQKRKAEEDKRRKEQEAQERKAAEEERRKEQDLKQKAEEERLKKEAEAKRKAEEERKKKAIEEQRKIEEERKRKKEEIKLEKSEPVKIEPSEPKPDIKPPTEPKSSEPRKKSNALKFAMLAGVAVLLIAGIWWWASQQQINEFRLGIERVYPLVAALENEVAEIDNPEQIGKLYSKKYTLRVQIEQYSEQAAKAGLGLEIEELQDRLNQIEIQLTNKKKELTAVQKGRVFVESIPNKSTVKVLNIDQGFRQGMELEPGKYNVEVSAEGYEPQDRWIELDPGEERILNFELIKIRPEFVRLHVETVPEDATIRILNIIPKFFQGMELEPGRYDVEVAAEGYGTQRRWVELGAGEKKRINFELKKMKGTKPISPQKTITNSIDMKFVLIQAGSFTMGSRLSPEEVARRYGGEAKYYKDEQPPHPVEITKPFYLQTTEVSQAQWKRIMEINPSHFKNCGEDCPVEKVSWDDAQKFIDKLNKMEGIEKYRLPTEAEWEYACRAKTTTPFFTGDCISIDQANYDSRSPGNNCPKGNYPGKPVKVGSFQPNAWGLYNMHGNVYEWCQDRLGDYPSNSLADPKGPEIGEYRVLRGGSWGRGAGFLRSADRDWDYSGNRYYFNGFRVARDF